MKIDIRHLEVVDAISRAGSATRAARTLRVTQPAVSQALQQLEERMGVQLFERMHTGMVITGEGKRVLAAARAVIQTLSALESDLRSSSGRADPSV